MRGRARKRGRRRTPTWSLPTCSRRRSSSNRRAGVVRARWPGSSRIAAAARPRSSHDRDYRPRADAESSLVDGKPGFFWRRHSIENYLLPPPIILQAFQNLRERFEHQRPGRVPPWIAALPADPEEVTEALCECAAGERRKRPAAWQPTASGTRCPLRGEAGSEANPDSPRERDDPSDWREALCQEAERVCHAAVQTAECDNLRREAITLLFDQTYAEVTADDYVKERGFLIDFHGRDLLKAFRQWLGRRGLRSSTTPVPRTDFCRRPAVRRESRDLRERRFPRPGQRRAFARRAGPIGVIRRGHDEAAHR